MKKSTEVGFLGSYHFGIFTVKNTMVSKNESGIINKIAVNFFLPFSFVVLMVTTISWTMFCCNVYLLKQETLHTREGYGTVCAVFNQQWAWKIYQCTKKNFSRPKANSTVGWQLHIWYHSFPVYKEFPDWMKQMSQKFFHPSFSKNTQILKF